MQNFGTNFKVKIVNYHAFLLTYFLGPYLDNMST